MLSAEPMGKQECGFFSGVGNRLAFTPKVITSGSDRAPGGFASYVMAGNFGWDTAIARMRAEAIGIGADGVIDVRLSKRAVDHDQMEFTARGTAFRSNGSTHLRTPFTTTLDGQDFAKLLSVGWILFIHRRRIVRGDPPRRLSNATPSRDMGGEWRDRRSD